MDRNIRVLIWGFGAMGGGMAEMLLSKKGVEISGVCDMHPDRVGRSIFDILQVERGGRPDVVVGDSIEEVLAEAEDTDIALLATDSFTRKAFEKIMLLVSRKLNVITTAEEMAYPAAAEPDLTARMDQAARQMGVTVLGTGINPGLIMDLLVIMMTGACADIESIRAERVNSLSPFGPAVMEEQGVGLTPNQFREGVNNGTLAGHVGFNESVNMIADALGWKLSEPVRQNMEPIITKVPRSTKYISVEAGNVAGCNMTGYGMVEGEEKIKMLHPQQIEPESEGVSTGDYITIKGNPNINLQIKPEVPGGIGTIAMCVNMIPLVIGAAPGLKTMIDLPVPRAILGDMRSYLENSRGTGSRG
jgi:4-hydroxy-tetrahydrodipicolinate reductase